LAWTAVAKFSPLIQIASTDPPVLRPACFSPVDLVDRVDGVGDLDLLERHALLGEGVGDLAGQEAVQDGVTAVGVEVQGSDPWPEP